MKFLISADTDVGISKQTNQDSLCVKIAETPAGQVLMAVLCDGMGGLTKGELASATAVRVFSDWFEEELPWLIERVNLPGLARRWEDLIQQLNSKILEYGTFFHTSLGTTVTALLVIDNKYIYIHVGDSRLYKIKAGVSQLTEDQTVVNRDVRRGDLSPQDARTDPRRNVLLQCVGALPSVVPETGYGTLEVDTIFMLCSDGLCHEITKSELLENLNPGKLRDKTTLKKSVRRLIDTAKKRMERDNISIIAIKACN